jgi:hypothetical protein
LCGGTRDIAAVEQDPPARRLLEAGDHPKGRRLAAAGRAESRGGGGGVRTLSRYFDPAKHPSAEAGLGRLPDRVMR